MLYKTVKLLGGTIRGAQLADGKRKKYCSFTRIPYANCPTGPMRFTESIPEIGWNGVMDCSTPVHKLRDPDEADLLFVNVYTTEIPTYEAQGSPKPVMVFIPSGGNYVSDHNLSTALYGPEYLIAEDVVLVVVSYRNGILGFISAPEMHIAGDMGMLDLIAALKWVRDNISVFNGDPRNVTIFAQGTGATTIQNTLSFYESRDLFNKLILQHGATDLNVVGFFNAITYARALGLRNVQNDESAVKFLRAIRHEKIIAYEKNLSALSVMPFTTTESDMYRRLTVPMIIGYNENAHGILKNNTEIIRFLMSRQRSRLDTLSCSGNLVPRPLRDYISEECINGMMPVTELEAALCLTNKKDWSSPVYLYRFNVDGKLNFMKKSKEISDSGAVYGDDLGYIFKIPDEPKPQPGSMEDAAIKKMTKYWTNFAKTGDPNPVGERSWRPVTKDLVSVTEIRNTSTCNKIIYETSNNNTSNDNSESI